MLRLYGKRCSKVAAEAFCSSMMLVMKRTVLLLLASLAMLPVLVPVSKMPFHNRPMGMKIQVSSTERLRQNLTTKTVYLPSSALHPTPRSFFDEKQRVGPL